MKFRSVRQPALWMILLLALGCAPKAAAPKQHADAPSGANGGMPVIEVSHKYSGKYPMQVACTTGMVADLVRNVGGKHVQVMQLMGERIDPHLYKATPGDVSQLNGADIIFYSGLHLEGKMADIFVRMARRKPTYAVTEYLDESQVLENQEGAFDPHLWFDVSLWSQAVGVVRDVLVQYDSANAKDYQANAGAYEAELAKLHEYAKTQLATIPKDRRVLVTAHDAFSYFGRAYGVEVRGIQGISTDSEAGVQTINTLVDFIVERKIKAVFVETSVSDRNMKALVEGCKAKGHEVTIGGELFSDAMGPADAPTGTYVGMVRHNVDTIVSALK